MFRIQFYLTLIVFLCITGANGLSQELLWPTDASQVMTSSFAEYRPGHFHAGLDISTWGRTGYKVFAIADGFVSQVRVSPFGYGRAVYLTLNSGETVVYAHLSRFNDDLEPIIEAEQERLGMYSIQKYFNSGTFPVKTGDLLAYSGQTGIGVPHLHFEIRDSQNRPINPLLKGYKVIDTTLPRITSISITPLDGYASINGDFKPVILYPRSNSNERYTISNPVVISGHVGFGISAFDEADGASNKFGIYELLFYVNETLVFSTRFDQFSYDVTSHLVLDHDFRLETRGYGRFYKLYRDLGNKLDFYSCTDPYCGTLAYFSDENFDSTGQYSNAAILSEGEHHFVIKVKDFFGNQASVEGTLIASKIPRLEMSLANNKWTGLRDGRVWMQDGDEIASANANISTNGGQTWRTIASMTRDAGGGVPLEMDSLYTEPSFLFSLENSLKYHVPVLLRVTAENLYGVRSYPYYKMINDNENWNFDELWFEVEKDYYDNYIRLLITASTPVQQIPTLNYWEPNGQARSALLYPVDFNKFVASIPLNVKQSDALPLEISARNLNDKLFFQKEVLHLTAIPSGSNKKIRSDDGLCRVEFAHNSLFKVMYIRILSETVEGNDRYDIASAAYNIEPSDMPMKGGAWVKIKYQPDEPDPSKLGVYLQINSNNWRFLDNHREKNALEISGKVKSFGTYALIRDNEPPEIAYLYPINNSHLSSRLPTLKARFYDSLSGVSGEDNMVIRLDGTRLISEYDPEQRILFHRVKKPLSPGKHDLTLYLKDQCGNESKTTHSFWID